MDGTCFLFSIAHTTKLPSRSGFSGLKQFFAAGATERKISESRPSTLGALPAAPEGAQLVSSAASNSRL